MSLHEFTPERSGVHDCWHARSFAADFALNSSEANIKSPERVRRCIEGCSRDVTDKTGVLRWKTSPQDANSEIIQNAQQIAAMEKDQQPA